jgi:signal transduction histidine kinase
MNYSTEVDINDRYDSALIGAIGAALALCFSTLYFYNSWTHAAQATLSSFFILGAITINGKRFSQRTFSNLLIFVGAYTCFSCSFFTGGITSTANIWFVNLLIFSLVICRLADFIFWTSVAALLLVSLTFVETLPLKDEQLKLFNHMNIYLSVGTLIPILLYFSFKIKKHKLEMQEKLETTSSASIEKDLYFKMLSHDLSTPIMSLLYATEYGDRDEINAKKIIKKSLHSIKNTVDVIKEYAESKSLGYQNFERTDVNRCVAQTIENLSSLLQSKEVSVKTALEDTEGLFIRSEARLLVNSIFANILTNAIKFSHQNGSIEIKSHLEGEKLLILFTDHGTGFDDKYFRSRYEGQKYSSLGTKGEQGSGHGITIVEELMKLHEGSVDIKSKKDNGTTITLTFNIYYA